METFDLESNKVNQVSAKQVKFAEDLAKKTASTLPSTSQMIKYCSQKTMNNIIDAMKAGQQIKLS